MEAKPVKKCVFTSFIQRTWRTRNWAILEPWEPLTHSNGEWDLRRAKDTFARITVFRSNKLLTSYIYIFIYLLDNFIIIIFISIYFFSGTKKSISFA